LPSLSEEIKNWLDGFWKSYDSAYKLTEETKNWEDFLVVSDAWEDTRLLVDTERDRAKDLQYDHFIGEYELFLTDAWYVCTRSEKGFRDVYDFNTEILPKLEKFREECKRQNMDDGEMEEKIEREKIKLIEEIRLVKKPKNANVVKAIFPELPFKDDSFDRFVASWSISAHTFSHLEKNEFDIVWKEIGRVMKEGGSAYVFPLSYSYIDKDIFLSSLKDMEKECEGMRYVFLNSYGEGIEYDDGANTLLLYKEKSQEKGGDDGSYYATAVNHIKSKLMSKSASQEDAKGLSRRPRVRRRGRSRLEKEDKI
jgi:hypothetical protein